MEQKLNLVEILKNTPEGTELYTLIYGPVKLVGVKKNDELFPITVKVLNGQELSFTEDGKYSLVSEGECILFPSKENRDWSNFKVDDKGFSKGEYVRSKNSGGCFKIIDINEELGIYSIVELVSDRKIQGDLTFSRDNFINGFEKIRKFDKRCFRPFDRVLLRDTDKNNWQLGIFSHLDDSLVYGFFTINNEGYKHCVPYNSDTEELLNTDDYAPEFYEEECEY
jgi:hypothetical protein